MTTSRALKIVARKYAAAHGIGYQRALQILFDPIQSAIAQNPIPHLWIKESEFTPFEWYRGLVLAESRSPLLENFVVTSMSPVDAVRFRLDLMRIAGATDIWQLRQMERAGALSGEALEHKARHLGLGDNTPTPIILHVPTSPAAVRIESQSLLAQMRVTGVYEILVGEDGFKMPQKADDYLTTLNHDQSVEWAGRLMQSDQLLTFFERVSENNRAIAEAYSTEGDLSA